MDLAASQPTAEHFHQWRKRVKYLRHQMEILEPLWPEVVSAHAVSLDNLGELLGDEHDLAVLVQLVADIPSLSGDGMERAMVAALAQHRRRELQRAALTLGMRTYAESPDRFLDRMGIYWKSGRLPPS
jgi:CHAD domain-containing protein